MENGENTKQEIKSQMNTSHKAGYKRGSKQNIIDYYTALAHDAKKVYDNSEYHYYMQHAEHYKRL